LISQQHSRRWWAGALVPEEKAGCSRDLGERDVGRFITEGYVP